MICVDASVFVSAASASDYWHGSSQLFFRAVEDGQEQLCCPALVLPECTGAVARRTGDEELAVALKNMIVRFPNIVLYELTLELAHHAADVAQHQRFRGADAVYMATAEQEDAMLVTWDRERLERGAAVVTTQTPEEWLAAHT